MMGLLASVGTVLGYIEDAVKYGPMVISFVHNAVSAVEQTDKSGPDKMTSVLNAVSGFAEDIVPSEAKQIEAFMVAIEALVNDIVAAYNAAGVFLHKVA